MTNLKIALAADHAGFNLKEELKHWLMKQGVSVSDFGSQSDESVDYSDFARPASLAVANGEVDFGVLICGSGIGMCMTANRTPGVRAVVLQTKNDAEFSRKHNSANVACFGARFIKKETAINLLDVFLKTGFEGGRHEKRIKKIDG